MNDIKYITSLQMLRSV